MDEADQLQVPLNCLLPGSHLGFDDELERYFPELGWQQWTSTFRMVREHPEIYGKDWPLREPWRRWCEQLFGEEPLGNEMPGNGKYWSWPHVESHVRRISASFERYGYRPDLATGDEKHIEAVIDSRGVIALSQGNKRVGLLRTFGHEDLASVPVQIVRRSAAWVELKLRLPGAAKCDLYQPYPHPDFQHWTVTQPCTERWDMIKQALGFPRVGSIVDLGCHTGWFCRAFNDAGWEVHGYDNESAPIELATRADNVHGIIRTRCSYARANVITGVTWTRHFDVGLCLSLLMHLFGRHPQGAVWSWLATISEHVSELFVDCAFGGYSDRLPFTDATMADEIIRHTSYNRFKLVGRTAHENRPLVHFWKT